MPKKINYTSFEGVFNIDIKERLKQYRYLKDEVLALESNMDIQGITKELYESYECRRNQMCVELAMLETIMKHIPDSRNRLILQKKYIEGKTWETICVEMNYSYKQICRIHSSIIQELRK